MKARKLKAVSGHCNTHTLTRRRWIDLAKRILGGKTSKDGRMQEGEQITGQFHPWHQLNQRETNPDLMSPFHCFPQQRAAEKVGMIQ